MNRTFEVKGLVERFSGKGGWYYVSTGMTYDDLMIDPPKWGLVPAEINIGKATWKKSLLPYGDGTLFVALSKKIRIAENLDVGDTVVVSFKILGF